MTVYEHWLRGDYEIANQSGVLKPNVIPYCEINRAFMLSRNLNISYEEAVEVTADRMSTSPRTVKRAISFCKK